MNEKPSNLKAKKEAIAIIGMGCRFPGGVDDPESFWDLLYSGVDAISEVPPERWNIEQYYDPDPTLPGKMNVRFGGFLKNISEFDPQFFGIAPIEARMMDPQQRLLLEVSWEALENAGLAPDKLSGTLTGVFIGSCGDDYGQCIHAENASILNAYTGSGNARSVGPGRLSYTLGLRGPSLSVDTSCSSSLLSVHLACQSLQREECHLALAGGVNVILSPKPTIIFSQAKMLASDGRCKAFDASADGYVRSEGCGMLILKRYSDALRDGDRVLALIRGSAINHDGRSGGLTVPNGTSQQAVIRAALNNAGVHPSEISYVEAHGTGTPLGDPIEAQALGSVLGEGRSKEDPFYVGAVKTNLGHLEGAAGVASLIKTVLVLINKEVPPHLHLKKLNSHILEENFPAEIPVKPTPLKKIERIIAGVSAFGFSGTNAHIILEEAPKTPTHENKRHSIDNFFILSGKSEDDLKALAGRYIHFLQKHPKTSFSDVCHTTRVGRAHFDHRLVIIADSNEQLRIGLDNFTQGKNNWGTYSGKIKNYRRQKNAFIFSGQGVQFPGMCQDLYVNNPIFRKTLKKCDEILRPLLDISLLSLLYRESSDKSLLNQTAYSQPVIFSVNYALANLWKSFGMEPHAVLGHSLGEYIAACFSDVMSLEDGLRLVALRGRLMQSVQEKGVMAAVFLNKERVYQLIDPYLDKVSMAAVNDTQECVISGEKNAVLNILDKIKSEGGKCILLNVSHAFHSPLMEPILKEFEKHVGKIRFRPAKIPIVSNLTGEFLPYEKITKEYWLEHLRNPVLFNDCVKYLIKKDFQIFLEISPRAILSPLIKKTIVEEGKQLILPALEIKKSNNYPTTEWQNVLENLAKVFLWGIPINWDGIDPNHGKRKISLPTYPFNKEKYWYSIHPSIHPSIKKHEDIKSRHTVNAYENGSFLGKKIGLALKEIIYEKAINLNSFSFLKDHRVFGKIILPAVAHLEMVLLSFKNEFKGTSPEIKKVIIHKPLIIPDNGELNIQLVLTSSGKSKFTFQIFSRKKAGENQSDPWELHCSGEIFSNLLERPKGDRPDASFEKILENCPEEIDPNIFYQKLMEKGLEYGEKFKGIKKLQRGEFEALGKIEYPTNPKNLMGYEQFTTRMLDCCVQLLLAPKIIDQKNAIFLPFGLEALRIFKELKPGMWCHALLSKDERDKDTLKGSLRIYDDEGYLCAVMEGTVGRRANREKLFGALTVKKFEKIYEIKWISKENQFVEAQNDVGTWIIFTDNKGVGKSLTALLESQGQVCRKVSPGQKFLAIGKDSYQINPSSAEDFDRLFKEISREESLPILGIIYLWALDARPTEEMTTNSLLKDQTLVCGGSLYLIQAMTKLRLSNSPRVCLVTSQTQDTDADVASFSLAQSTLWGLGKVISLEHPEFSVVNVDLGNDGQNRDELSLLLEEILTKDKEPQVAIRGKERKVPRVARTIKEDYSPDPIEIKPDGTYLITGGLGGLGLFCAEWIIKKGGKNLVLVSRKTAQDHDLRRINLLKELGANLKIEQGDVSLEEDVSRILKEINGSMPPLKGIIHAAGILDDGILLRQDWLRFSKVLAPKVGGAWNLHHLSRVLSLDFFVLFSSMASILGSIGQGNYSAANAFLDTLAHDRKRQGLPALSINWGPWSKLGMAGELKTPYKLLLNDQGINFLKPEEALDMLEKSIVNGFTQIGAFSINWKKFFSKFDRGSEPTILSDLAEDLKGEIKEEKAGIKKGELLPKLKNASTEEREEILVGFVKNQIIEILGLDPTQPLDLSKGFFEIGMDSLMAVELQHRLQTALDFSLPSTVSFDQPNVEDLAKYLNNEVLLKKFSENRLEIFDQSF